MRKSRAAILPFPGDPFLLHYWLGLFDRVWSSEIDRLYVYMNSPIEYSVVEYVKKLCADRPKVVFLYNPEQIEHGEAINRTLDHVSEENVMLIEDDGFIFRSGRVDKCFTALESGQFDIVGSKRGSCSEEILQAAKAKWGFSYEGIGDQGCNFWPNFFFTHTDLLLLTDRAFGARAWQHGQTVVPLGYVIEGSIAVGDTFVNTSLQLQAKISQERIMYLAQYHGHPDDISHFEQKTNIFDGNAAWCHIGSLSSGVGGCLTDGQNRPLTRRLIDPPNDVTKRPGAPNSDMERMEWERRAQWWLTFYEKRDPNAIPEFAELYRAAVERLIMEFHLQRKTILYRQRAYAELGL